MKERQSKYQELQLNSDIEKKLFEAGANTKKNAPAKYREKMKLCMLIYQRIRFKVMGLEGNFEQVPLKDFAEKAYLDYSMYVILDRALPHIGRRLKTSTKAHYLCHVPNWA